MKPLTKMALSAFVAITLCTGANAQQATLTIEVPKVAAREYHRPYVAAWIENTERKQVVQITHWLEQEKWHRDLRSWWRRGGRKLPLPIDGVTGATRPPGIHILPLELDLPHGEYSLNVEAAREVGGREHLRLQFYWQGKSINLKEQGKSELGQVTFKLTADTTP